MKCCNATVVWPFQLLDFTALETSALASATVTPGLAYWGELQNDVLMENLKKTVPRANRIGTGRSLCQLAELGMKDSDGPAGSSSNRYQGKKRCPVENIRQYPSFEAMRWGNAGRRSRFSSSALSNSVAAILHHTSLTGLVAEFPTFSRHVNLPFQHCKIWISATVRLNSKPPLNIGGQLMYPAFLSHQEQRFNAITAR